MILSYNTTKVNHDNSSIGSVEEEEFVKIEDIMKRNAKIESKNKVPIKERKLRTGNWLSEFFMGRKCLFR